MIAPGRPLGAATADASAAAGRVEALDALRGVALFGIFVVNLPFFAHPVYAFGAPAGASGPLARAAAWLDAFAFQGKFFVLFSFLFGYGFAVQLARGRAAPGGAGRRYARRLVGLLVFGVVHATCLFVGDILVSYVLLGAALWAVRDWTPPRLVRLGVACLALAVVGHTVLVLATGATGADDARTLARLADEATRHYRGGFGDAVRQRVRDLAVFYAFTPLFNWPTIAAMFAFGLAAGKSNLASDLARHRPALLRRLPLALGVGVVGNALYAGAADPPPGAEPWRVALGAVAFVGLALAGPALTYAYAVGVMEAARRPRVARWLAPVRAAGRMSLTNYLGQAVVASLLFNGYGLGWYGRVGPDGLLVVAVAVYAAQLAWSTWWLRHFRLGPDEWLLRCWSNGRWEPLRRAAPRSYGGARHAPAAWGDG